MTSRLLPLAAFAFVVTACTKPPAPVATIDPVTAAATIAKAINASPSKADSILLANHYTAEAFEKVLWDIAADSTSAAAYAVAMR